jgi:hypothetical protein
MMNKPIEERIASALAAADDVKSVDLATLIREVETAAQEADEAATQAREQALDPAVVVDVASVGAAVATATLTCDRLQAALPRLQERLKQAREREYTAAWREDFERVEAKRDALVEELREEYLAAVAKLIDILSRIPAIDKDIDRINGSAPPGVSDRLLGVEQKARGVKGFGVSGAWEPNGLLSLAADLKLPKFEADGNRYQYSWPPPQPNLALQIAAIRPDPFIISEAAKGTYIKERDRRVMEDNQRQIAEAEQRQRELEERESAEARKAQEAERAAYYAKHGWPT